MRIDRCQCFDVSFETLNRLALETGATTIAQLQEHSEFGHRCRLCHPYVRRMLRTGEVVFDHVVTDRDEPGRTPSCHCG